MSLALLFQHLVLNMFRMLVHPSSGAWTYCGFIPHRNTQAHRTKEIQHMK